MTNNKNGGQNTGKAGSGFFADSLGPRPPGGAMLGKNGAAPQQTQAQHVQQLSKTAPQVKGASQSAPPRAAAAPPKPEPEKKKKGWF